MRPFTDSSRDSRYDQDTLQHATTILVVDDEQTILNVARLTLARRGYHVLTAEGGNEALELCGAASIQLIVSDVVMPGMHGPELLQRLRARHPGVRVLFMSAYQRAHLILDYGMPADSAFLRKPFVPAELEAAVRRALGDEAGLAAGR